MLLDEFGQILAVETILNPQSELGADVVRRMEAALRGEGTKLQSLLIDGLRSLLSGLLLKAESSINRICRVVIAANPAISHFLQNLPVDFLLFPPHRPHSLASVMIDPVDLGLDLSTLIYLFPLASGYVGGDLIAFLLSCPLPSKSTLYVDVGTNAEMALFTGNGWLVTSVAAGPAFEGGNISCGMPYEMGAVESVRWEGDTFRIGTVGNALSKGLSGRGLLELVAVSLDAGLIDATGRIVAPGEVADNRCRYIVPSGNAYAIRFSRDASSELLLNQEDVRNFQFAKGAVKAGIDCLMERGKLREEDLYEVIITGAFGVSLSAGALKRVAMIPEKMVEKVRFLPDGVLVGLSRYLTGKVDCDPEDLAKRLRPFPLSGTPAFERAFLSSLDFQRIDQG